MSTMTPTPHQSAPTRMSVLGGEVVRRGLFSQVPRSTTSRAVGAAALLTTMAVAAFSGSVVAAVVAVIGLAGTWWLVWPVGVDEPRLDRGLRRVRSRRRAQAGLSQYTPAAQLIPGDTRPAWELPPAVGAVRPLELAGTAADGLFVLHHTNRGETHYLSVVCATDGLGSGLRSDAAYAANQEGFGQMLFAHSDRGRLLSGLQQLNRVVPHDAAQHRAWMADMIRPPRPTSVDAHPGIDFDQVAAGFGALVSSYEELVDAVAGDAVTAAEQHRNYLVARFDLTPVFLRAAARIAPGEAGWALAIRNELRLLADRAQAAGLGRVDVLGEQRTVAAMRALQNPDNPPDRHGGLRWADAFCAVTTGGDTAGGRRSVWGFITGAPKPAAAAADHLLVDGRWYTRTAYLPIDGLSPALLGPRWLAPVLTDVNPAVVRTLSTRITLVPAAQARAEAVQDKTHDTAGALKNSERGKIDDGTDEELLSASSRRLRDLAPASGAAGIRWALFLTVQARSYDDLLDSCDRLEDASGRCGINRWHWCDYDQDTAWPAALPLARGMRT